ncbi:radical SAM protein [Candidatus Peregrinibacteria bacterium]|nr:radical SAM protein [Candidatus Peregrinibacteria bacterium]
MPSLHKWGLEKGIIYGPYRSRRYGWALGINILPPNKKVCSMNCTYCQYGWTPGAPSPEDISLSPSPPLVEKYVEASLALLGKGLQMPQSILICGNGEPTLHPKFTDIVKRIVALRDKITPSIPIICVTNGTELANLDICKTLTLLDEVAIKLDAGDCDLTRKINIPWRPHCTEYLIGYSLRIPNRVIQSCFVTGCVNNTGSEAISEWVEVVRRINPLYAQVYTIDRQPPNSKVLPVEEEKLEEIANRLNRETNIPAKWYKSKSYNEKFVAKSGKLN